MNRKRQIPDQPGPSSAQKQPERKKFKFVESWPANVTDDAITIFSNLGSSYINVITTPAGSILISCGLIQGSTTKLSLYDKSIQSVHIGPEEPKRQLTRNRKNYRNTRRKVTAAEKRKWYDENKDLSESTLKYQILNKLKNALFKQDNIYIIQTLVITSKDEDTWNLLPSLCFDASGNFKSKEFRISYIIIHGAPHHYSRTFRNMIEKIMVAQEPKGPLVFFTSLKQHLSNTEYLKDTYVANPTYEIAPKMYYDGQDINIQETMRDVYKEAMTGNQVALPYYEALTMPVSRDVLKMTKKYVRIYLPIINGHHTPRSTKWSIPEMLTPNEDNLMVGVALHDDEKGDVKILFLEDAKSNHQKDLIESYEERRLPFHSDVLILQHNADPSPMYCCREFLEKAEASVLLVPNFETQGYPLTSYFNEMSKLPGLGKDTVEHDFVTGDYDLNGEQVVIRTKSHIYSLHQPVSILITKDAGLIRQWNEALA